MVELFHLCCSSVSFTDVGQTEASARADRGCKEREYVC